MSSPPYHLRPNKAADRFALLEAIRRLQLIGEGGLEEYRYIGMGGPYLEDFRLLYEFSPEIRMTSIEQDDEVYKRQKFHRPFRTLKIERDDVSSFIGRYDPGRDKSIFWLDYTTLKYCCFQDFMNLLGTVTENSMIKITLRSECTDYWNHQENSLKDGQPEKFQREFGGVLPDSCDSPPRRLEPFALLLQRMLRIAAQKALRPGASHRTFIPVSSFCYSDSAGMFTLTGIVCSIDKKERVIRAFNSWEFANLEWKPPTRISLPVLSTQERLHLQRSLPTARAGGSRLRKRLGYQIEDSERSTEKALDQYAAFHRYSPFFMRATP